MVYQVINSSQLKADIAREYKTQSAFANKIKIRRGSLNRILNKKLNTTYSVAKLIVASLDNGKTFEEQFIKIEK